MKTIVILFSSLFIISQLSGQSIRQGNILGFHQLDIDLKPGVSLEAYLNFWEDMVLPAYQRQLQGVEMQTIYGLRGQCEACIGLLMVLESEKVRNQYWKEDGSWSDLGKKKLENIRFVLDELTDSYGTFSSAYTDWVVAPDMNMIDLDLRGSSAKNTPSIKGTWALISGTYSGKERQPQGNAFQYKIFDNKYSSLIMVTGEDTWNRAAVGTYKIDGSTYTETFLHSSDRNLAGGTAKWSYTLQDDTLRMSGPILIIDRDGKPAFPALLNSMDEVRVRVD